MRVSCSFLERKEPKELPVGLVKGLYVNLTDIPYESFGYFNL